jgi:hypothetical protein
VDLASIEKTLPKGIRLPPLLRALGEWLGTLRHGSLGYFEVMGGSRFADGALSKDANKKIAGATGIFMSFGEGSALAFWKHGKTPPAIVLLDSEGQHRTVAPSLEAFLIAWSKRETGTELDGKYLDDAPAQRHAELAAWLREHDVEPAPGDAPNFGAWFAEIAKSDAPPDPADLPAPPEDMAPRVLAALGKLAKDPELAALLAELGIDLARYKTADAQRHLLVPVHGYALSFEKKVLKRVTFANAGYRSWDYANAKHAAFNAFPHEIVKGMRITDDLAVVKEKLGKAESESAERGTYYYREGLLSVVAPDVVDGPIPPGTIQYFANGVA